MPANRAQQHQTKQESEEPPATTSAPRISAQPKTVDFDPPLLSCLAQLFSLLGKPISIETLKAGLAHDSGTINPTACIRAAEQAGMAAKTVYRPAINKIASLTLPCILLLENQNACVLQRVDGASALVSFPESGEGSKQVSLEELQQSYTGYTIFTQLQGRLDQRASDLRLHSTKEWFWGTLLKFWPIYKHVLLASLMVNVLAIASPLFVMNVYDRVVPNTAIDTLWVLAVGVALAFLFDFILRNLRGYFVDVAGRNTDTIIASKLMQQLMGIRLDHKPESTGSLANNLREFESLREFFSSTTLLALVDLPFIAIFISIIAYIAGPLAIVPTIAVPIVVLVGLAVQIPFQKVVETSYKEATQKNALLVEIISGLEAIKTSLADGQMQKRWEQVVGMSARSTARARALATFSLSFSQWSAQMVTVGIIVWGVYLIGEGKLTMGGLIACSILVGRAMSPLGAIAAMLTRLQQSRMALKSLDLLMNIPSERNPDQDYMRHDSLPSSIQFDDVSFQYPAAESLSLHNINLQISAGEKVGIIGRVGSGKSTLSRLILGLYEPQQGKVKIGGVDLRQLDIADLRRKVGYVAQDGFLFYGSVRDNIALGQPFADDRSVFRAAVTAGAADFVRTHPAGFGMQVGERGQNLSGGQRQSVAIARTLLQDPDILVFDEPTNSMDNATEAAFLQRLTEECKDRTLIMITHRHSMLDLIDRLIVLDTGRIVADGPKEQVLEALKNQQIRSHQPRPV